MNFSTHLHQAKAGQTLLNFNIFSFYSITNLEIKPSLLPNPPFLRIVAVTLKRNTYQPTKGLDSSHVYTELYVKISEKVQYNTSL